MSEHEQPEELTPVQDAVPAETTASNPPRDPRSFIQRNLVRIALGVFLVIVLVIVIAVASFWFYRESRNEPIEVAVYPGAQLIIDEKIYDGLDHQQYLVNALVGDVEAFYERQDDMNCQQYFGGDGQYLHTVCDIDRSWFDMTQAVQLIIQPQGDGAVLIDVRRTWGT